MEFDDLIIRFRDRAITMESGDVPAWNVYEFVKIYETEILNEGGDDEIA